MRRKVVLQGGNGLVRGSEGRSFTGLWLGVMADGVKWNGHPLPLMLPPAAAIRTE